MPAEISMKCTTQLVTGLDVKIATKDSYSQVNMRNTGVSTLEKTDISVGKKVVLNIMVVQELETIMKGSTMLRQCTVISVKLLPQKSAIKNSTADNIYSSITKVSMAMDGMQNVVRTILGQHNALLMKKNVLLVEKLKSRRKLVNWLRGNELFLHIIENVKFLVLK